MTPRVSIAGALLALATALAAPGFAQEESTDGEATTTDEAVAAAEGADDATIDDDGTLPASGTYDAVFSEDLYVGQPLMLNGILALKDVPFSLPPNWEITGDLELHVLLDHSETLLPSRSSMTVLVNNRAVDSFFLDESNAVAGEVVARVPREILDDYNAITFTAVQHYTTDCEDPFDPNLWSRVSNRSFLRIPYRRKAIEPDLVQFPAPFFNENGLGPVEISLVAPSAVPQSTIEALGVLGLAMGRIADYRGIDVTETVGSVRDATGHAILVGTYDSHPDISDLISLEGASPEDGVVAMVPNPADPSLAVLIVTGETEEALVDAAFAIAGEGQGETLSGERAVVKDVERNYPDTRRKPTPAPVSASRFTLGDMNFDDISVRGFYSEPVVIPLMLEGDAQIKRPDGGSMRLHYGYSAQLDTRLSTVEVKLNGVVLASRPLDKELGDQDAYLDVRLPPDLVEPKSIIKVRFHLFPKKFDACELVTDQIIWGTVFSKTSFSLPRDNFASMPDLGRLSYDLYPFTMAGDDDSVTVVTPDAPTREDAAAAFIVSSALGWRRTVPNPRFRATTADAVGNEEHMILLHSGRKNSAYERLQSQREIRLAPNTTGGQLLTDDDDVALDADLRTTYGTIEQIQRTGDKDGSVLVLRATSPEHIVPLAEVLLDDERLEELDDNHNIAIIPEEVETAAVASIRRGKTHEVGTKPISTRVTAGLRKFWPAFFFLLLGAALLFALTVSLWARRNGAHT